MSTPNDLTKSPITHTPGPWRAKVDLFRPPKLFVHAPDSFAVCRVMTAHYHAETAKANAHLIAAAPELLEVVRELAAAFNGGEIDAADWPLMNRAMAAIAKAEGQ